MSQTSESWSVVVRSQERVLVGLERGECDGILPDEWLEPDQLIQTALDEGFLDLFDDFADPRQRRSIDKRLFCRVLLCARLMDARSIAQAGRVIFHSATLLDKLGFNFRMIREGGRRTGDHRLFDEEALEDYFAKLSGQDYLSHQLVVSEQLRSHAQLQGRVWVLDCRDTKVPNGHHQQGRHWKAGVLSVCAKGGPYPMLWNFGEAPQTADLVLARPLVKAALEKWEAGAIRWLIMDAGLVDGPWLRELKEQGIDTVIRIREGMDSWEAAVRYARRAPPQAWQRVPLPKRHKGSPLPVKREILGLQDQPGWETLEVPIALSLVRDTYADKGSPEPAERVEYWLLVSTDPQQSARQIYEVFRLRWGIEETFMALARYHGLNELYACRDGLALAIIHFTLLAYTLRYLCRCVRGASSLPRTKYLVVYWAGYYALLHASQVFERVFDHWALWEGRRDEILEALRYCEGR
jgi:hypothetical protein